MGQAFRATCSCEACALAYSPGAAPGWIERIACACSLCARTDAWFPADPKGQVAVIGDPPVRRLVLTDDLAATEMICQGCGDFLGSFWRVAGNHRIALNGRLLDTGSFIFPIRTVRLHMAGGRAPTGREDLPRLLAAGA